MKFYGTIKKGKIVLSVAQLQMREKFLSEIKDDTPIEYDIKKVYQHKTVQQTKTYWGLAIQTILSDFNDRGYDTSYLLPQAKIPTGTEVSKDLMCEYLYACCPTFDDSGKRITLSKMTTKQAADFFDRVRNYASSQWGVVIPDPNPFWKQEIET